MAQVEALLALAIRDLHQAARILSAAAKEIAQSIQKERR